MGLRAGKPKIGCCMSTPKWLKFWCLSAKPTPFVGFQEGTVLGSVPEGFGGF